MGTTTLATRAAPARRRRFSRSARRIAAAGVVALVGALAVAPSLGATPVKFIKPDPSWTGAKIYIDRDGGAVSTIRTFTPSTAVSCIVTIRPSLWRVVGGKRVKLEAGRRLLMDGCQSKLNGRDTGRVQFKFYLGARARGSYSMCVRATQRLTGRTTPYAHETCQAFGWPGPYGSAR